MNHRRHAWLIGAYYFFLYGAIGCLIPYLPLYYQRVGLRGEQIGSLLGLGPLLLLVLGPWWGALGDRFNLHRQLLPLTSLAVILPVYFISLHSNFYLLLVITFVQAFFATAIGPLIDSAALEVAETVQVSYGNLRLGGSIGFSVASLAMGWLLTRWPLEWLFYGYMLNMALAALVALPLPARRSHWQAPMWQGFQRLFSQPSLALFLGAALLIGISINAAQFFFPLYVSSIGGDSNVLGIAGAVAAFSEIPVMFYASRLIQRLGGLWVGLATGAVIYILRWFALSWVTTPATVVLLQLLHGASFGLFLTAGVAYVDTQSPPGLSATAQALFIAMLWGLGAAAGSFGGGIIFERLGAPALFQSAGVIIILALFLLFASRYLTKRAGSALP